MQFLYIFSVMFLMIFGFAMLIHVLVRTLTDGCTRRFDVYVRDDDGIEEFLQSAKDSAFIGEVYVIENGTSDKFGQ